MSSLTSFIMANIRSRDPLSPGVRGLILQAEGKKMLKIAENDLMFSRSVVVVRVQPRNLLVLSIPALLGSLWVLSLLQMKIENKSGIGILRLTVQL